MPQALPPHLTSAQAIARLGVKLEYPPDQIISELKQRFNLSDSDARDVLAVVQERNLAISE